MFGASGQRNRVVARIARAHRQQLRDVAAARAAEDAEVRRVAFPFARFRLQPAHAVARVLHRARIRRFGRVAHVDRDDEHAAFRHRLVHRHVGEAVLVVPRAAVHVEEHRERSRALRLVDARHQRARRGFPELDVPDFDFVVRFGVVGRHRRAPLLGVVRTLHAAFSMIQNVAYWRLAPGDLRMELKGCAAIVTGGSGGLGQRICRALALNGVNVVVNYAESEAKAKSVAEDIVEAGRARGGDARRCDRPGRRERGWSSRPRRSSAGSTSS